VDTLRSPSSLRDERGVTMAEILTVVAIVGIVSAIVAPKLDLPHYAIDSAMRTVGTTLMAAQRDAVAGQHDVIVSFDSAGRELIVHWDQDNDGTVDAAERVRTLGLDDGVTFGRPSGVTARSFGTAGVNFQTVGTLPAVIFRRAGSASESGGIYLTSVRALRPGANRPDDTRAIEFERATGRAEWFRFRGSWQRGF
jgi:prepilin-type N-terminal cleavage/methylation domain-containing protein